MRNQNHQESRTLKGRANEKTSQHKKTRKYEVLVKYKSLFHNRNSEKKDIPISRLNQISSINLRDLPKTLQAYYSVYQNSKNDNESISEEIMNAQAKKKDLNNIEGPSFNEKIKHKGRNTYSQNKVNY